MRKIRNFLLILILSVSAYGVGNNLGKRNIQSQQIVTFSTTDREKAEQKGLDFSLFWEVWDRLNKYYLEKSSLEAQKMMYGAISGMVASLGDPYTVFLTPEQNKEAKNDLAGKFEGIGAQLGVKDKKIVIIAPLKNSPAEIAGLVPGDWIIKVDGKDTYNWTLPEAIGNIRGAKGSKVKLTIVRKEGEKGIDIDVLRDEIKVASVEREEIFADCRTGISRNNPTCEKKDSDCIGCFAVNYIKLTRFGEETNSDWTEKVNEVLLHKSRRGIRQNLGLILDVRNNPGGYLAGSVFIASEFIKDGTVVIQENSDGSKKNYQVNRQGRLTDERLVVLINKGSASASEIVAGALKIRRKIPLIGETSYGKGTIQEAQELKEGAGIHITTAKWLLPDNSNLNGNGIKPDIEVSNDENNQEADLQLEAAITTLFKNSL